MPFRPAPSGGVQHRQLRQRSPVCMSIRYTEAKGGIMPKKKAKKAPKRAKKTAAKKTRGKK